MSTPNYTYCTISRIACVISLFVTIACGPTIIFGDSFGDGDGDTTEGGSESGDLPGDMPDDDTDDGDGMVDPGGECGDDMMCSAGGVCVPLGPSGDGDGDPPGDGDGDPTGPGCEAGDGVLWCPCYDGDLDGDGMIDPGGECFEGLVCDTSTMICLPL